MNKKDARNKRERESGRYQCPDCRSGLIAQFKKSLTEGKVKVGHYCPRCLERYF